MMRTKSSRPEQFQQAADEAFRGLTDHERDHPPAVQIMADFPLRNADPQAGQLRRRFFAFAIAALAAAIFIILYLGDVKTTALPSELTTARSDFETMAELASKAADETAQLRKTAEAATAELQQERQKTVALTSELATARSDFETMAELASKAADKAGQPKKSAEAVTAELQQERQKTAALTSELAATRREIEMQSAQSRKATETVQLRQAEATESATLIKQEREKTAALAQEVAEARQELITSTAKQLQAIDEERARSAALASELETTQRAIETREAQSQKAVDEATQQKQAAEATIAELRQSLQQERDRTEAMARDLASVRRTMDERVTVGRSGGQPSGRGGTSRETAATEPLKAAEGQGNAEAAKLIARANALLGQGNIGAARIVLERAAEAGSAQATFALAETYDPNVLAPWRTPGTRSDARKARDLYARAYEGGIKAAKDRSQALVIAGGERKPASWFGRDSADH